VEVVVSAEPSEVDLVDGTDGTHPAVPREDGFPVTVAHAAPEGRNSPDRPIGAPAVRPGR